MGAGQRGWWERKIVVDASGREKHPSERASVSWETFASTKNIERACVGRAPVPIAKLVWYHDNEKRSPRKKKKSLSGFHRGACLPPSTDRLEGRPTTRR